MLSICFSDRFHPAILMTVYLFISLSNCGDVLMILVTGHFLYHLHSSIDQEDVLQMTSL